MDVIAFAAVSRNYFNLPIWLGHHHGLFAQEGLDVVIELHEGVDEVTNRLRDGRVRLAYGISEHVVLDREAGGHLTMIGGNVNKLPFSLIGRPDVRGIQDLRGRTVGVSSLEAGSSSLVMKLLAARGLEYPRDYQMRAVGPILARWELLQSGEIDAGLQGAPLNYIAMDEGFANLCDPRVEVPDFQFTSLNVDRRWAAENEGLVIRFVRAFVRAHELFFTDEAAATDVAMRESGIARAYAERAWREYSSEAIFPRDGDVSDAAVQALIEISALIRALPTRQGRGAADYIERHYLQQAWA